jgi:hypothetical protein
MQYAIIPQENQNELSWIYDFTIGKWKIPRIEVNGNIKTYTGLEAEIFNQEQIEEIILLNGQIFNDCECFFSWRDQYGIVTDD